MLSGETAFITSEDHLRVGAFFSKVYAWMSAALAISAGVAWYMARSGKLLEILQTTPNVIGMALLAEVVVVIALSFLLNRISAVMAGLMFALYAALTGFTLSVIFLVYTSSSIATTFLLTGASYAAMGIYGYTTRKNLGAWGGFLFMSLVGMIIASLINLFLRSPAIEWITAYAGIVVFAGLTAYDHQKLKALCLMSPTGGAGNLAIYGALSLYLDFVNLFLSLLRAFGRRR